MGKCLAKPKTTIRKKKNTRASTIPVRPKKDMKLGDILDEILESANKRLKTAESEFNLDVNSQVRITGKFTSNFEEAYEDREVVVNGDFDINTLSSYGIGLVCKKGLKDSQNQDNFSIVFGQDYTIFCVFDGHGLHGHKVSNFIKDTLPTLLQSHFQFFSDPLKAISYAFEESQDLLERASQIDLSLSGTTVSLGLVQGNTLYYGYVGDSRGVLGIRSRHKLSSKRLSEDHKPNLPEENERIETSGGEVRELDKVFRVFGNGQDEPGLAISRTIGDLAARKLGVISTPELMTVDLNEDVEYLVIGTDGLWERVNDQEVIDILGRFNCQVATEKLAKLAWNRSLSKNYNADDITIISAHLPHKIKL